MIASAYNAGDPGSILGSGRSPEEGNGNPLQYSCLEDPMDGGAWWATVHGVAKSWTQLNDFTFDFQIFQQVKALFLFCNVICILLFYKCHIYIYTHLCVYAEWFSHVWPFCDLMECSPPDSLCPWQELDKNFPDKNTRVGCRFIFVTLWYRYYT